MVTKELCCTTDSRLERALWPYHDRSRAERVVVVEKTRADHPPSRRREGSKLGSAAGGSPSASAGRQRPSRLVRDPPARVRARVGPVSARRRLRRVSFGGTAAVVTSIGLVVGFATATASRGVLVGSLLIVGIADNITDSLSVHIYQESEGLEPVQALRSTFANFLTRLVVTTTFVAIAAAVPRSWLVASAVIWGTALLAILTKALARQRGVSARRELVRHLGVAVVVVLASVIIGKLIGSSLH